MELRPFAGNCMSVILNQPYDIATTITTTYYSLGLLLKLSRFPQFIVHCVIHIQL